ncbi:MAG: tetratricopeptide repeat protein [Bacteroidota bacterium]
MKNYLGTIQIILLFLQTGFISVAQQEKMPVTSSSGSAVELYYEATAAMENAELARGEMLLNEALKKDPEFFMGLFQLALNNLYSGNLDKFKKCAESAFISYCAYSEGEKILQEALKRLYENPKADVTDLSRELIQLYPEDKLVYYTQLTFQSLQEDYPGISKTCNSLLEITNNPAPAYNILGYNCMRLNDFEAAEMAFDKYIEFLPDHPNPHDSKGDFYMEVKDYPNAYSSYMTANRLNNSWSYEKMMKAKKLMEAETASETKQNK